MKMKLVFKNFMEFFVNSTELSAIVMMKMIIKGINYCWMKVKGGF
jgi:hypothetical protein